MKICREERQEAALKDTAAPSGRADPLGRASQAQAHKAEVLFINDLGLL